MKFLYKARTKEGELQVGNVEAPDQVSATNTLLSHGLFVLSVESRRDEEWYDRVLNFFKRVKLTQIMVFTRQFSTLLASQVSLSDALGSLYKQTEHPVLKESIYEISNDVQAGFSLSQALDKHTNVFSDFYINMVRSAEVTGRLSEVLEFLADYLEGQVAMQSKIKNALSYPIFVIILSFVVMGIIVTVVFPQIIPIFQDSNIAVPWYTALLLSAGTFLNSWWWAMIFVLLGVLVVLINYFQTNEGRVVFDETIIRLPVLGNLFQKIYVARFAESTRVLIKGGLTIPQAVEISARTIGSSVYQELLAAASEDVRKGKLLSKVIEEKKEFPPLVSQLIAIGESTGRLEELLQKVRDFYMREIEDTIENSISLIQPVLMVFVGVVVAFLFAGILLPLFSLTQTI
jgi:type IV pilus assembly protein PilC